MRFCLNKQYSDTSRQEIWNINEILWEEITEKLQVIPGDSLGNKGRVIYQEIYSRHKDSCKIWVT